MFIEVNLKNGKVVIGCIYRHPSMELLEFNNDYLANLLDTLSSENKTVVLLGDFNAKYDQNSNISDFLDLMYSSPCPSAHLQPNSHYIIISNS